MDVLMLGWEFPPYISGGLGTACQGLTEGLSSLGTRITFVLPHELKTVTSGQIRLVGSQRSARPGEVTSFTIPGLKNVELRGVNVQLNPYARPGQKLAPVGETVETIEMADTNWPQALPPSLGAQMLSHMQEVSRGGAAPGDVYGGDLFKTVAQYCASVCSIARAEKFDVVHAHDWMTFAAGVAASRVAGKPLVVHVHSTEFDRNGEHIDQRIYDIERQGMHCAKRVIAVSRLTRQICIERYGVPQTKVSVVYNGVRQPAHQPPMASGRTPGDKKSDKVVLFLGRITMQKGPEYFLAAAKKVLERVENVKFIMAGTGDQMRRIIEMAAGLGIGQRALFAGFLQGGDVARAFRMADLYVMPSVSEPFGIAPLEALAHRVPVLISKQSGVAEVLTHALKVDFWDIDEMANKMIAVLTRVPLQSVLRENGCSEVRRFDWAKPARQCAEVYGQVVGKVN
jgi:glycosyltransferase involved in cell wall biosynthesis